IITLDELLPIRALMIEPLAQRPSKTESLNDSSPFFLVSSRDSFARFVTALLGHYDKDNNEKLSRAEIGLPKEVFDDLDANRDGELDRKELVRLLDRLPAVLDLTLETTSDAIVPDKFQRTGPSPAEKGAGTPNELQLRVPGVLINVRTEGNMNADFRSQRS